MKRWASAAAVIGMVLTGTVLAAGPAAADERRCTGTIGAVTVDDLVVPAGKICVLNGTRVEGTIKIERSATLRATAVRVDGNVQSQGHKHVTLARSTVGGSVQLKSGVTATLDRNTVKGDIQLFSNTGRNSVTVNRVDGNLQCKSNKPVPVGSGNVVKGNKEDQCRKL